MYLNIITPCSRPQNLEIISKNINIPRESYRWIVVFDLEEIPKNIPSNCEYYLYRDMNSMMGNAQRNFALNLISSGYAYFNDDDTTIHPELWESVKNCTEDFISFKQNSKDGNLRLSGNVIQVNHVDSHNFLVSRDAIGDARWVLNKYEADGIFANEVYNNTSSHLYIPKVLSIYNSLK